jgi:nicotinamidase-related amidase
MTASNSNSRTTPPQNSRVALLMIDVITDFEFEDGDKLLKQTQPMAIRLAKLRKKAKRAGAAVIYVNDNFGKWQEDFKTIVAQFTQPGSKGREVVDLLKPEPDDYYVLKPHRSAFYSTSLMLLLENLNCRKLIITGVTTDICILFSANDAYMRGFELHVPSDCVAAVKDEYSRQGLSFIKRVLKADTRPSDKLRFDRL